MKPVTPLGRTALAAVHGGMKWEDFRQSTNVEDYRQLTPRQRMRLRPAPVAPLPPLHRTPGDLSSQAGLDDMNRFAPRRRRRR